MELHKHLLHIHTPIISIILHLPPKWAIAHNRSLLNLTQKLQLLQCNLEEEQQQHHHHIIIIIQDLLVWDMHMLMEQDNNHLDHLHNLEEVTTIIILHNITLRIIQVHLQQHHHILVEAMLVPLPPQQCHHLSHSSLHNNNHHIILLDHHITTQVAVLCLLLQSLTLICLVQ